MPTIIFALLTVLIAHAAPAAAQTPQPSIVCGSKAGERQTCAADTSGGVTLVKPLGTAACELGKTWGYDANGVWVSDGCAAEFTLTPKPAEKFGRYTPMVGTTVASTDQGDLTIRLFTYLRYLNQAGTDPTYTDASGVTRNVQQRRDLQVNKLQVYFHGWLMNPKFRYLAYVWTSNSSLGTTAQVVVAGNLQYSFNDHVTLGGGINALPGVRSTSGNFPFWLAVDSRLIADEYFRPSYTTGLWATGNITKGLSYQAMIGNNLSQFGIDAGQLDPGLDAVSTELAWTTGNFGRPFGDFASHATVATRIAGHYTRSKETRQGQPDTDGFDNVQIRVSDGTVIFAPNAFADNTQIEEARYQLVAFDAGIKYRGFSFDAEHYKRHVDELEVRGAGRLLMPFTELNDTGFVVQASAMAIPKRLQVYMGASKVYGEYGDPRDVRVGATIYPWKNEVVRWNLEYINLDRSPVGALSLPYSVGSNGSVFHTNFMVWF